MSDQFRMIRILFALIVGVYLFAGSSSVQAQAVAEAETKAKDRGQPGIDELGRGQINHENQTAAQKRVRALYADS